MARKKKNRSKKPSILRNTAMQQRSPAGYAKAVREKELKDNRKRVLQTIKNRQSKADAREAQKRAEQRERAERVRRQMAARAREEANKGKDSDKPENKYQDEIDKILDKDPGNVPDVKAPGEPDTTPNANQPYLDAIASLEQQIADFTVQQPDYEAQLEEMRVANQRAAQDRQTYMQEMLGQQRMQYEEQLMMSESRAQAQAEAQQRYQTQLAQQQAAALQQRQAESRTATANLARSAATPDFRIGAQPSYALRGRGGTLGFKRSGRRNLGTIAGQGLSLAAAQLQNMTPNTFANRGINT
jgi:hypothetical protein